MDLNSKLFIELVQAGLWEKEVQLSQYKHLDFSEVYRIAEEQSVIGLVAAGLEHVSDMKVPQEWALQFAGLTLQLEQRNKAMNAFVARLIERLRTNYIFTLLVKGQGIAQCYERPLWRTCGDVDLLFDEGNYIRAKDYLIPFASSSEKENIEVKHLAMSIDGFCVELHGSLRSNSLCKMDKMIDEVQHDVFMKQNVRLWNNCGVQTYLPAIDNDIIFVFSHILKHFFRGGIGLRQICDWCRLLWTFKDSIDLQLLDSRIKSAGIETEWKTFAAISVEYLGMPTEAMPLYSKNSHLSYKAKKVMEYIMRVGNFGHNRDLSFYTRKPLLVRKSISFGRQSLDGFHHFSVFPLDSLRVWGRMFGHGLWNVVVRGRQV